MLLKVCIKILFLAWSTSAATYKTYDLNDYCGSVLTLPWWYEDNNRAGVLQFTSAPTQASCTVNVTVDGVSYETYAIYFNVKYLNLYPSMNVNIYESYTTSLGSKITTLVKQLPGGYAYSSSNPTSVAQLCSSYQSKITLSIQFTRSDPSFSWSARDFRLDYNVLHGQSGYSYIYCSALTGWVGKDYYCETGDRVNCPNSYTSTSGLGNYAILKDQGTSGTYGSSCRTSVSSYTSPEIDVWTIAGPIIGGIFGLTFFIVLVKAICRNQRGRLVHRHAQGVALQTYPATSRPTTVAGPYVVGAQPNYPLQPQPYPQLFVGAPPTYAEVQSSTAAGPDTGTMPDASKY
ncbi:hypothetical protein BV898_13758 [Hypsibius exemplaris]|uniref:CUB domain-containing protein n=1 Tax=Hypsibius exemplaris TaxID=2072580 RepID=A0A1W0W9X3_HYPEX|nr:hypothetical protein BV898_13758 [Hypsibius exemplaris]